MSVLFASHRFECVRRYRRPTKYGPPVSHPFLPLFDFCFIIFDHVFEFCHANLMVQCVGVKPQHIRQILQHVGFNRIGQHPSGLGQHSSRLGWHLGLGQRTGSIGQRIGRNGQHVGETQCIGLAKVHRGSGGQHVGIPQHIGLGLQCRARIRQRIGFFSAQGGLGDA